MASGLKSAWLWISAGDLRTELRQLEEEGRDVTPLKRRFHAMIRLGDDGIYTERNQRKAADLLDAAGRLKMRKGYPHVEPSDLKGIRKLRGRGPRRYRKPLPDPTLKDRVTGAWLGRCVGCLLGKAAEGVRSDRFWPFLKATRQWPISDYVRFGARGKAGRDFPDMTRRNRCDKIDHMPIDDDTNYTTTGFLIVKQAGADFTPADVGQFWLGNLPLLATCTAERVAYRNLAMGIQPPASAAFRNPFREWIGAQIRADALGYVNMGNSQRAAEFAWRDASISHVKNGIYGEMFVAAMIAAAPYCDSPGSLLKIGLSEIPATSRLHADVTEAIEWHRQKLSYDEAVQRIHAKWDEKTGHDWCHTNSNAVICATALLWGEGDFGQSVCRAVQPCFDTDCNGATVGSIMGMMLGARKLPGRWTGRLNDTLHTSLTGYPVVRITEIARQTFELFREIR
jgi:ADP-ribosylglycohydrolase